MGKKGGSSSQTVTQKPPAYLVPYLETGVQRADELYQQGAPAFYAGQTYADFDPLQLESMNKTVDMARAGNPLLESSRSFAQQTLDAEQGQNPYLADMLKSYGEDANAMVMANFAKNGRMGSGANAGVAGREITKATLPYLLQQYNTDADRSFNQKLAATNIAKSVSDEDYANLNRIGAVGDLLQTQTQRGIDEDRARYDYNSNLEGMALDDFIARINNNPMSKTGSSTTSGSTGGGVGSTLGGIASGLGILGGLGKGVTAGMAASAAGAGGFSSLMTGLAGIFSDRRLKERIVPAGQENGHNIYEFSYKTLPERRFIGVMAQEVEKTHPHAVINLGDIKAVDYDAIGVKFREVKNA